MKTLENFQAYLDKHPRMGQNFTEICRMAGLVPDDVNELLQRELGVSGEEYLKIHSANERIIRNIC